MRDLAFIYAEGKDHSGRAGHQGHRIFCQLLKLYIRGGRAGNQSAADRDLPEQRRKETRTDVHPEDNLCLHSPATEKGQAEREEPSGAERRGKDDC